MNLRLQKPVKAALSPSVRSARRAALQRKCACGGSPDVDQKCPECLNEGLEPELPSRSKRLSSATPASRAPRFGHDFSKVKVREEHGRRTKVTREAPSATSVLSPTSPAEREADALAARVASGGSAQQIREVPAMGENRLGTDRQSYIATDPGSPLPSSMRFLFEARFGRPLDDVRIHTGQEAQRAALALHADAFTLGHDIYFAAGKFIPETIEGRRLIVHELTHTIQQQSAPPMIMRQAMAPPSAASAAFAGCPDATIADLRRVRGEAAKKVTHVLDLLQPSNVPLVAELLRAHFRLEAGKPDSEALFTIRGQFNKMERALRGGDVRIFCRNLRDCPPNQIAESTPCGRGSGTVTLCGSFNQGKFVLPPTATGDLEQTLLHEFAHVACDGEPPIKTAFDESPGGKPSPKSYYDGNLYPGEKSEALNTADCYAWFAQKAAAVQAPPSTTVTAIPPAAKESWWTPWKKAGLAALITGGVIAGIGGLALALGGGGLGLVIGGLIGAGFGLGALAFG